jgi:hypothetical protein
VVNAWARELRDAVLLGGLWVAAVLWIAYGRFYGQLGTTSADVGIGFGDVVERSLGAVPLMILLELLLLVTAVAVYLLVAGRGDTPPSDRYARIELYDTAWGARRHRQAPHDRRSRVRLRPHWTVGPAADGDARARRRRRARARQRPIGAWALFAVVPPFLAFEDLRILLVVCCVIGPIALFLQDRAMLVADIGAVKVLAAILALGTAAVFWLAAGSMARRVKDGTPVELRFLGVTTYAIRAAPAQLKVHGTPHCVLYLGSTAGRAVLYDHGITHASTSSPD